MRLTPFGKVLLALIILGSLGYVVYRRYGDEIRTYAGQGAGKVEDVSKDDFNQIGQLPDAPRDGNVQVTAASRGPVGEGKLSRPLRVAINTWAGHAPGIVANGGMDPGAAASIYKKKYGLDVQFTLIEDPTAKL